MSTSLLSAIDAWRAGDPSAAAILHRELTTELLSFVRRHRTCAPSAVDSEVVVNAAMMSFLTGVVKGEFDRIEKDVDVLPLLKSLAKFKLIDEFRSAGSKKRDYRRNEPLLDEFGGPSNTEFAAPEDYDRAIEIMQHRLREMSLLTSNILERYLQGHSVLEIAREFEISVRNVQLNLRKVKQLIGELYGE